MYFRQDYFQKAAMYESLACYYKYSNPEKHIMYYQKHLKYMNKAIESLRSHNSHQGGPAKVRVLHASPDAPNVDIYVNGAKVLKDVAFKQVSDYLSVPAGKYQIDIYPTGNMTSTVLSKKVTVEPGNAYTLAATGLASKLRLTVIEDDPFVPTGETKARFIHLSPDAPAVDIAVKGGDVIFPNVKFREVTDYLGLTPMTVNLEARVAGTSNVALSVPNVQLQPNKAYTIVAVGLVSGDPSLDAIILPG